MALVTIPYHLPISVIVRALDAHFGETFHFMGRAYDELVRFRQHFVFYWVRAT